MNYVTGVGPVISFVDHGDDPTDDQPVTVTVRSVRDVEQIALADLQESTARRRTRHQ